MTYLYDFYLHGIYVKHGWSIVLFLLVSPILEEIVFRGLFQEFIVKIMGNKLLAFIVLNIVFMLAHWNVRHDHHILYLFLIFLCGICYSLIKDFFGSLRYPIGAHICCNLIFLLMCQ